MNYCYHVVLAHLLGPSEYGSLATLLNLTTVMVIPASVVTLIYTRFGRREQQAARESWLLWSFGVVLWILMVGFRNDLAQILRVGSLLVVIFTLELIPSLAIGANMGILQHVRRYWAVGLLIALSNGVRVLAALATMLTMYRLLALGLFEAAAAVMTFAVSRWLSAATLAKTNDSSPGAVTETALVGVANVVMAVADGMISKHNLSPFWAGEYNGLATIGHAIQYISGSLGTVMLTSILAEPKAHLKFAGLTLAVYGVLSASAQWVFCQRAGEVVELILGQHFVAVVPYLGRYGWGMMAVGFLNITLMYAVASKRWTPMALVGLGIMVWVGCLSLQNTFAGFVNATVVIMGATAAAAMGMQTMLAWRGGRNRREKAMLSAAKGRGDG